MLNVNKWQLHEDIDGSIQNILDSIWKIYQSFKVDD